jgi:hypothetical protein
LGTFDITLNLLFLNAKSNAGKNEVNPWGLVGILWQVNGNWFTSAAGTQISQTGDITKFRVTGIDLISSGQVGVNTLDVLAVRNHSWDGGSYRSYMGHNGTDPVFTQGVYPVPFPAGNYFTATYTLAEPTPVPEPATIGLLGLGALALGFRRKIRR